MGRSSVGSYIGFVSHRKKQLLPVELIAEGNALKTKLYIGAVLTGAPPLAVRHITARNSAGFTRQTRANLSTAMHGEAFADTKYLLYAKHAKQQGNTALAGLLICKEVSEGEMPGVPYTLLHRPVRLSPSDARAFCRWTNTTTLTLPATTAVE